MMCHLHPADVNLKHVVAILALPLPARSTRQPGDTNRHDGGDLRKSYPDNRMKRNPNPNCRPRGALLQSARAIWMETDGECRPGAALRVYWFVTGKTKPNFQWIIELAVHLIKVRRAAEREHSTS